MAVSIVTASVEPYVDDHNSDDFSSGSSSWSEPFEVEEISWISMVMGIIVAVTVVGNIFVIVAFVQNPKIRNTVSNLFILNLSIAGCIVGAIVLPINTSWVLLGYWPYGKIFCQVLLAVDFTADYISVLMITLISLDRFWLVTKKLLKYQDFQTRRQVKTMIAICWVVSLTFYSAVTFAWESIAGKSVIDYTNDCEMESLYNAPFNIALMFIEFIIPLIVIATLNLIVYANIRKRAKVMAMVMPSVHLKPLKPTSSQVKTDLDVNCNNGGGQEAVEEREEEISTVSSSVSSSEERARVRSKKSVDLKDSREKGQFNRHRKAAITLAILVAVFLACRLPYYVTTIWTAICDDCVSNKVWKITNNILWCNSTINPFLYAFTNAHYRRSFTRFLGVQKCLKRCVSTESETTVM